jgi:hypothetical protein
MRKSAKFFIGNTDILLKLEKSIYEDVIVSIAEYIQTSDADDPDNIDWFFSLPQRIQSDIYSHCHRTVTLNWWMTCHCSNYTIRGLFGKLHSLYDQPSLICQCTDRQQWHSGGLLHRGYQNGKRLPADVTYKKVRYPQIQVATRQLYYLHGKLHRNSHEGPAFESLNKWIWYLNGKKVNSTDSSVLSVQTRSKFRGTTVWIDVEYEKYSGAIFIDDDYHIDIDDQSLEAWREWLTLPAEAVKAVTFDVKS